MEKSPSVPLSKRIKGLLAVVCMLFYALMIVVCVVACGRIAVYWREQDDAAIQGNLKQIAVSFREELKRMDDFVSSILPETLEASQGLVDVGEGFLIDGIRTYFKMNTDCAGMTIYTSDGNLIHLRNTYSPYDFHAYSDFEAFQLSLEMRSGGIHMLIRKKDQDPGNEYLEFVKRFSGAGSDTTIMLNKNTGPYKNELQELSLPKQGSLAVLNAQNDVLLANGARLAGSVDRLILNALTQSSGSLENVRISGDKQHVFYEKTVLYGCTVLFAAPTTYFERVYASLFHFACGIFLAGAFILLAILLIFHRWILNPVAALENCIAYLAQDRLHYEIEDVVATDKALKCVTSNLISVTSKLNNLTKTDISLRTMLKQAELDALQSQISPHFLYNTLETIRGQAMTIGAIEIERMAKALSELFRYSIVNRGSKVSLQEELKNVDNYLSIQKFRFGDKFSVLREIDEDTLYLRVPKLLIQPLVENAFQHGLEQKVGTGTIAIRAYTTQHRLIIQVEDDGVGISDDKRKQINEYLIRGKSIHINQRGRIGLSNVNDRIKLNYGDEYGIKLYGIPGKGTLAEVDLPLMSYE